MSPPVVCGCLKSITESDEEGKSLVPLYCVICWGCGHKWRKEGSRDSLLAGATNPDNNFDREGVETIVAAELALGRDEDTTLASEESDSKDKKWCTKNKINKWKQLMKFNKIHLKWRSGA